MLTVGKIYKLTFDAEVVSGGCDFVQTNGSLLRIDSTQSYELIFTADVTALSFAINSGYADLSLDNISVIELEYNSSPNTSDTYGSCSECIQGCTDALAFNYNDSAMVDDGSCLYGNNCAAPYPLGLNSSDIYAEMATVNWLDANAGDCRVWKYFVRYRALGDTVWTTKSAGVDLDYVMLDCQILLRY